MFSDIKILSESTLSDSWYLLRNITFTFLSRKGFWNTQTREVYDRGNGATILLYNKTLQTVILTKQFRLPTYVNGNTTGMLIECCAGLIDDDSPEEAIKRETEEETGYILSDVNMVFEAYMSPGSVTEKLFFFIASYTPEMKERRGGGVDEEEIEVLELSFKDALDMLKNKEIEDGKTIMLLQHLSLSAIMS